MKNRRKIIALFALAGAMLTGSGMVAGEVPDVCAACHNDNGVTTDPAVPTLAGNAAFFSKVS